MGVAFSQREDRVYSNGYRNDAYRLDAIDLGAGTSSFAPIANFTAVIGTSIGCPVLYESTRGAWRSCGACEDAPVGGGEPYNPFGAQGGRALVGRQVRRHVVERARSGREDMEDAARRPAGSRLSRRAAAGKGGSRSNSRSPSRPAPRRALTGAAPAGSCYFGPQFPLEVHDVGTNTIVDTLPPAPAATDGTMRTVAYGAQLWCAR